MKLFKEICQYIVICYISCFITKMAINKFVFDMDYLLDSVYITIGATIGWFGYRYLYSLRSKRK